MRSATAHLTSLSVIAAAIAPALAGAQVRAGSAPANLAATPHAELAIAPACGATPTTTIFGGTSGPLAEAALNTEPTLFTATVSGLDPYLWDVNLNTSIAHTWSGQLEVKLTSPAGTTVVITTGNGHNVDHVFNGTVWDDNVNKPVTFGGITGAPTPSLSPEGRLSGFRGEDPNGTWTLSIRDTGTSDTGTLNAWSLDISTLAAAPVVTSTTFSTSPNAPFGYYTAGVVSTIAASGLGAYLMEVELYVEVASGYAGDLQFFLQSPLGPQVIAADEQTFQAYDYYGAWFDVDAPRPVTDSNVAPFSPEGSFDNWLGTDPNGTWTLTVNDTWTGDDNQLDRWDVVVRTIPAPTPSAPVSFAGTTGSIPDFVPGIAPGTSTFTTNVSGVDPWLWDVDLTTAIQHPQCGEIDVTLTSPAGTVVAITTNSAWNRSHVFNGTVWDDNVNDPVTDHVFTNLVTVTPLSPEGRLAAFRGEDPNGTWTLTIADEYLAPSSSTLSSWSLAVSTLPGPIAETTHPPISRSPNVFVNGVPPTLTDTMPVSVTGTAITDVELYLELHHFDPDQLLIVLVSPQGTAVTVSTNNGYGFNGVLDGTVIDVDAPLPVTDIPPDPPPVAVVPMSPEGAFDNFVGQNPNGDWKLEVTDIFAPGSHGTLRRWDLRIRTCSNPPPVPYCFGDGSSLACPCSPVPVPHGAPGRGCPTNLFPGGALATATGNASLSADTLVLTATDMIDGAMIFYQGALQQSGGAGAHFGDGKRCIAPSGNQRFPTKFVVGNTASYPVGADLPLGVAGHVMSPGTRNYQGYYRSANPTFCTPGTFNLTNGLLITWVP